MSEVQALFESEDPEVARRLRQLFPKHTESA